MFQSGSQISQSFSYKKKGNLPIKRWFNVLGKKSNITRNEIEDDTDDGLTAYSTMFLIT